MNTQNSVVNKNYIVFATANKHKLEEVQVMMPAEVTIRSLADIGYTGDIPETGTTLEDNALQKARFVHQRYAIPCFADDTGLEVEALGGDPGVYSARYAGVEGSQETRAKANMNKLLRELAGKNNRNACFRTVIAYIDANGKEYLYEGMIKGSIISEPTGEEGFGYDPIFLPDGYDITFAQMPLCEKNLISHRAKAFQKFSEAILK